MPLSQATPRIEAIAAYTRALELGKEVTISPNNCTIFMRALGAHWN